MVGKGNLAVFDLSLVLLVLSLTYDDKYLLTGAGDGNVFVYKTNLPANRPTSAPVKVSIVCVHFVVPFCV